MAKLKKYPEGGNLKPVSESTGNKIYVPPVVPAKPTPAQLKKKKQDKEILDATKDIIRQGTKYTPSSGVDKLKMGFAVGDIAGGISPAGFYSRIAGSTGDAYTAARYFADGQIKNGFVDLGEAVLDLIPYQKGRAAAKVNTYNKLNKAQESFNKGLKVLKIGAQTDDLGTPFIEEQKENGGTIMKNKKQKKALNGDQVQPLNQPQQFQQNGQFQSQWDVNQTPPNLPGSPSYLEPLTYTQPKKKKNWWEQSDDNTQAPQETLQPIQPTQGLQNPSTGLPKQFTGEDYDQTGYKAPDEFSPIIPGPKKSLRNTQMKMNLGLSILDNFIPGQQPKSNSKTPRQGQVETNPLQYGAPLNNNQGIGQTAISKNGSTLEKYPEGGSIKKEPIIVNNPNDPRLKAYNDSLTSYLNNETFFKKSLELLNSTTSRKEFLDKTSALSKKYPSNNKIAVRSSSIYSSPKLGDRTWLDGSKQTLVKDEEYKKPVQPVVYQKPKPSERKPIITNDPKDPRLKAYNDSLSLYNNSNAAYHFFVKAKFTPKNKAQEKQAKYVEEYIINNSGDAVTKNIKNDWYHPAIKPLYTQKFSKQATTQLKQKTLNGKTNVADVQDSGLASQPVFMQPVQPVVYQKEATHPNPGKGEIIPIEHPSLQQGQTNQNFDRNLSTIDTTQQPTNYSFHYPIEGTFNKGNPQGVKYFKDRQEWQKFLDENDYNSAEEKNGVGQASGILKMYNGGNLYAEQGLQIENDAYTPLSPSTYMLDGKSHAEGGTDISYGSNPVEAEKGEPIAINDENNLVIFGNRKPKENPLIKQHVKELGLNPNSKYKSLVKEIGTQEGKQQKLMNKASSLLENNSPQDKWEQLSFNSGKAMLIGSNQELENLNMKKNSLGKLQEIQNAFFPDKKAKNGKTMKAGDGLTDYIRKPEDKQVDWTKAPENFTDFGIQPYEGDVNNKSNASIYGTGDWNRLAQKAGFTGKGNDEFQKYLYNHPMYGSKIKELHQKYGIPKSGTWNDKKLGHRWDEVFNIIKGKDRGEIVTNKKDLKPGIVDKDLGPLQPVITDSYTPSKKEETNTFNFDSSYKKKPFQKGKYDWLNDVGEIQALTYNPQAVNYSTVQPHLDQPYNVSFQDRRNQVISNLRASNQAIGDNPAAQAVLMGQANEQLQPINGEEFRTNQAIYSGVLGSNNQKLDAAAAYNASKYDAMSENAAANRFNKFATTKAALQSMGQKRLQFDQGQNELEAFNNMLPNYNINPQENNVDYSGADPRVLQSIFGNYTPLQTVEKTVNKTDSKGNNSQTTTSVPKKTKFGKDGATMSHSRMMKLL